MKTASKWVVLSSIAFLGLSMAAAILFSMRIESELISRAMPLQDASMMVKCELNRFHYRLDEHIYKRSGGTNDASDVWETLDRAQWLGNVMLTGGRDDEWTYTPLQDKELRGDIEAMNADIGELRGFASELMGMHPGSASFREAENRLDTVLVRAYAKIDHVEDELHRSIREKRTDNRMAVTVLLILCGAFTMVAVTVTSVYMNAGRRASVRLAEAHASLQDVVDGIDEPIMVIGTDYNVTLMNLAARNLSGTGLEMASKCHMISHGSDEPCNEDEITCPLRSVIESGNTVVVEHSHFGDHHESRMMEVIASPLRDRSGELKGIVHCSRDITARKELERQRADFLAMMTHDIKSPLTAMAGYTEMILAEKSALLDGETREMVNMIGASSERLLRLVQDFLSVSQMEAGKLTLSPFPADMAIVLRMTCAEMEKGIRDKNIRFETDIPDGLPSGVRVDEKLLGRAVLNLLANAAAYTPPGGAVSLTAQSVVNEGAEHVVISVTDTGPGIPKEEHARVFDKYYRSGKTTGVKGTGLGLAIVKAVAEAHGGRVELESEPGKGSTFSIFIPVKRSRN